MVHQAARFPRLLNTVTIAIVIVNVVWLDNGWRRGRVGNGNQRVSEGAVTRFSLRGVYSRSLSPEDYNIVLLSETRGKSCPVENTYILNHRKTWKTCRVYKLAVLYRFFHVGHLGGSSWLLTGSCLTLGLRFQLGSRL
jgi:hypothetical protein